MDPKLYYQLLQPRSVSQYQKLEMSNVLFHLCRTTVASDEHDGCTAPRLGPAECSSALNLNGPPPFLRGLIYIHKKHLAMLYSLPGPFTVSIADSRRCGQR